MLNNSIQNNSIQNNSLLNNSLLNNSNLNNSNLHNSNLIDKFNKVKIVKKTFIFIFQIVKNLTIAKY